MLVFKDFLVEETSPMYRKAISLKLGKLILESPTSSLLTFNSTEAAQCLASVFDVKDFAIIG